MDGPAIGMGEVIDSAGLRGEISEFEPLWWKHTLSGKLKNVVQVEQSNGDLLSHTLEVTWSWCFCHPLKPCNLTFTFIWVGGFPFEN